MCSFLSPFLEKLFSQISHLKFLVSIFLDDSISKTKPKLTNSPNKSNSSLFFLFSEAKLFSHSKFNINIARGIDLFVLTGHNWWNCSAVCSLNKDFPSHRTSFSLDEFLTSPTGMWVLSFTVIQKFARGLIPPC